MRDKKSSLIGKILFGNTKTKQVSSKSKKIVGNKFLSVQVYENIDNKKKFIIKSKDGNSSYTVRQLSPSK